MNPKKIYTGLYSKCALHAMEKILFVICDEDSHRLSVVGDIYRASAECDNEVVLTVTDDSTNTDVDCAVSGRTQGSLRKWLASRLLTTVKQYACETGSFRWEKDVQTLVFPGYVFDVKTLHCVYDILCGDPKVESKYGAETLADAKGTRLDPVQTELEKARRDEIERVTEEFDVAAVEAVTNHDETHEQLYDKIEELECEIMNIRDSLARGENELCERLASINSSRQRAIDEINAKWNVPSLLKTA